MKNLDIHAQETPVIIDGRDVTYAMPLTGLIRRARKTLRVFTFTISALFINALVTPDVWAIQDGLEKQRQAEKILLSGTPAEQFNQALLKLQAITGDKQQLIAERLENESGILDAILSFLGLSQIQLEDTDQLEQLYGLLQAQHENALEDFQISKASLLAKELPAEIIDRHDAMVVEYQAQYDDMISRLANALAAGDLREQGAAIDALNDMMKDQKLKRSHQTVDPENLPWGSPDADKVRKPAKTTEELNELTGIGYTHQGVELAANEFPADLLGQPGGPTADDLAPTVDAQITEAIEAKAAELEHDPLKIYTWVRNNIEFIPSYGSIQGAEYTLQSGKGNAFDTASLTIALLRASNIPARYAYGTVEIPTDKVMNWVGGVEVPTAAQQLLGQGGIPNVGINVGGQIASIEMEHVWVEAWVDYFPSRGAKHQIGDSWVPMDASFKQYEFTEGINLQDEVPLDAEALIDDIAATADINEAEGSIAGIEQAALEQALQSYQDQVEEYIDTQNPEGNLGDYVGSQKIILKEYPTLAAGLPYYVVSRTQSYPVLPDDLRHKFRYTLANADPFGFEGTQLLDFVESLPSLAGKRLALVFNPATEMDEQTLLSFFPSSSEEDGIDPSALPENLPGHLVKMKAQFLVDGQIILSEPSGNIGGELKENLALFHPSFGWSASDNTITTGEYQAIGLGFQGTNAEELIKLQTELDQILEALESGDSAAISDINGEELSGSLLSATITTYLRLNALQDNLQARKGDVVTYQQPSYGKFSTRLTTSYWFGIPRSVTLGGLVMDVDRLAVTLASTDNTEEPRLRFMRDSGYRASAMEHIVPEQVFSTEDSPAQGVSAVKALGLANLAGQKIWSINRDNVNIALSSISLSNAIETEIRNSVAAGKVVTAHESPVQYVGSTFVGYIILDPVTGAGAYKIGGGENGGILETDDFLSRFMHYFSMYGIQLDVSEVLGLLLFGSIPKTWVGRGALLGSKNPLTSVLRGLFKSSLAKLFILRLVLIPAVALIGTFIGFFNITTMIMALIYAI